MIQEGVSECFVTLFEAHLTHCHVCALQGSQILELCSNRDNMRSRLLIGMGVLFFQQVSVAVWFQLCLSSFKFRSVWFCSAVFQFPFDANMPLIRS